MSYVPPHPVLGHFNDLQELVDSICRPGSLYNESSHPLIISNFLYEVHCLPSLFGTTHVDQLFCQTYQFLEAQPIDHRPSPQTLRDFAERYSYLSRSRALLDTAKYLADAQNSLQTALNTYQEVLRSFDRQRPPLLSPEYHAACMDIKRHMANVQHYQEFCHDAAGACK